MKPISIIFLIFSLILALGGFLMCTAAKSIADKQGIGIYGQSEDENGDIVYNYELTSQDTTKLTLQFSDVNVDIVRSTGNSYIQLKNFDIMSYRTSRSGSAVTVDGTTGFISSMLDTSSGGLQFKGLRSFLADKPKEGSKRSVTLYIADDAILKTLIIKLDGCQLNIGKVGDNLDINASTNKTDININGLVTSSVIDIVSNEGNIRVDNSQIGTLSIKSTLGDVTVNSAETMKQSDTSYKLKAENGDIVYNKHKLEDKEYILTDSSQTYTVTINAIDGNVTVYDGGKYVKPN